MTLKPRLVSPAAAALERSAPLAPFSTVTLTCSGLSLSNWPAGPASIGPFFWPFTVSALKWCLLFPIGGIAVSCATAQKTASASGWANSTSFGLYG